MEHAAQRRTDFGAPMGAQVRREGTLFWIEFCKEASPHAVPANQIGRLLRGTKLSTIIRGIRKISGNQLPQIIRARRCVGFCSRSIYGHAEERHEDRDDGDRGEQFDERECAKFAVGYQVIRLSGCLAVWLFG